MRGWVGVIGLVAACTHLRQLTLVPAATGKGQLEARVVSMARADGAWYVVYALELHNPTTAAVEVDLGAAKLAFTSMFDSAQIVVDAVNGGDGEPPDQQLARSPAGRVSIAAGETRSAWVAFGGKLDGRARWSRRESLSLPAVGEILLDERGPERPEGIRDVRGTQRAVTMVLRSSVDLGNGQGFTIPYQVGGGVVLGDLRVDVHAGDHVTFDAEPGGFTRTSGFTIGPGVSWRASSYFSLYAETEYERLSFTDAPSANAAVVGGGAAFPLWMWKFGTTYDRWRIPIAQIRLGWAETLATGSSSGTLRIGLEISPAWLP